MRAHPTSPVRGFNSLGRVLKLELPLSPVLMAVSAGLPVAVLVQFLDTYPRYVVGQLGVLIIITLGLNIVLGVAGLMTIASPAFVGIGAYGVTILMLQTGIPVPLAILISVIVGWLVGWTLGLVSLRLADFYLAMVTLGFLQVFLILLFDGGPLTGGGYGLVVPSSTLPLLGRRTVDQVVVATAFLAVCAVVLTSVVYRSRVGRAWTAIKNDPVAAELQGIDIARMKTLAFAVSSAMATLAGCLQALLMGVTNPTAYEASAAVTHIAYVFIGGAGASILGPILGPTVLFLVPEMFRQLGQWRDVFYGAILLMTLVLAPQGLGGAVHDTVERLRHGIGSRREP